MSSFAANSIYIEINAIKFNQFDFYISVQLSQFLISSIQVKVHIHYPKEKPYIY
jgi:hypothetical protein